MPEDIFIETKPEVYIHGWLFEPETSQLPYVFILFHGNAENLTSHYTGFRWVVTAGASLFVFDYQGYGKSQGSPSIEDCVRDGIVSLQWIQKRFPKKKLVVIGQSLGGAIALRALQELETDADFLAPSAIILEGSFLSYREVGAEVLSKFWITWLFQPAAFLLLSDRWAPRRENGLDSPLLKVPKLVIHNEADPVVAYRLGKQLYSELSHPKTFWTIPAGRHLDTFWRENPNYRDSLIDFLNQNSQSSKSK